MPLDGQQYLVSQGWRGKGTGLRDGAITRPLAIPQKNSLAGVGRDRDEAFPFWDHLFSAAAKSIQLRCSSDSDGEGNIENLTCIQGTIRRTTTGIPSNRRPVEGTPATSNPSTPGADSDSRPGSKLIATAKRDAAKQNLYSRFFRGPVLGPEDEEQGSVSHDKSQIEESIDAPLFSIEGSASKRKRGLEGIVNGSLQKQKNKRDDSVMEEGKEGLDEAAMLKQKKRKKKDKNVPDFRSKAIDPHSLAGDPAPASGSERKRRKELEKRKL